MGSRLLFSHSRPCLIFRINRPWSIFKLLRIFCISRYTSNTYGHQEKTSATKFWGGFGHNSIGGLFEQPCPINYPCYRIQDHATRLGISNFVTFPKAVNGVWWVCYLDKLWHNPNASFTNSSPLTKFGVTLELSLKFLKLSPRTDHSTPHQSFTNSLSWPWPCTPTPKRQLKNLRMFRRSPERSRLQRNTGIYPRDGTL